MQYTEEQKSRFKREFAERRRKQMILVIPFLILIVGSFFMGDRDVSSIFGISSEAAGLAFLILVAGALAFSFRNWRCPACDKYLGKVINPKHCHACGIELR